MEQSGVSVGDYLAILRRRKRPLVVSVTVLLLIIAGVAISIPPTYEAKATILIQQPNIPDDLVRSTVAAFTDQRLEVIDRRVLAAENLRRIIEKHDLYADERKNGGTEAAISDMRSNIEMMRITGTEIDSRTSRSVEVTVAFTVLYRNESPELAQKVVSELANHYLEENARLREEDTVGTSGFLQAEAERLGAEVSSLEKKLAKFKEEHAQRLPEYTDVNIQMMERTDSEIRDTQRQIQAVMERKIFLEAQLVQIPPYATETEGAASRLVTLQAEYAAAAARYSSSHPDLIRMRNEIASLQREVGGVSTPSISESELARLRDEIGAARQKYSEDHPDVKRLKASIARLQEVVEAERRSSRPSRVVNPDNAAYVQIQAQLEAADAELRSLEARLADLNAKYSSFVDRVYQAPGVEREYLALTRDYDNALRNYRDIRAKQMEAQLAVELEQDRKGERFAMIEPPSVPSTPTGPGPLAIMLVGSVMSFGVGIGTVAIIEFMDRSVRNAKQVMAILGAPPLVGIPYIPNNGDFRRRMWSVSLGLLALISAALVLAALYLHYRVTPLPALVATLLA